VVSTQFMKPCGSQMSNDTEASNTMPMSRSADSRGAGCNAKTTACWRARSWENHWHQRCSVSSGAVPKLLQGPRVHLRHCMVLLFCLLALYMSKRALKGLRGHALSTASIIHPTKERSRRV
jgi:hypothetical protein